MGWARAVVVQMRQVHRLTFSGKDWYNLPMDWVGTLGKVRYQGGLQDAQGEQLGKWRYDLLEFTNKETCSGVGLFLVRCLTLSKLLNNCVLQTPHQNLKKIMVSALEVLTPNYQVVSPVSGLSPSCNYSNYHYA